MAPSAGAVATLSAPAAPEPPAATNFAPGGPPCHTSATSVLVVPGVRLVQVAQLASEVAATFWPTAATAVPLQAAAQ